MSASRTMNPEWKEWIIHNVCNGCTSESIVSVMIENGFEAAFAQAVVQLCELEHDSSYVYEPSRLSSKGNYIETWDRKVRISAWLDKPCIVMLDDLLTAEECEKLIGMSREKLARSMTIDPVTGEESVIQDRTSWGAFFEPHENEFIAGLERRISEVMNGPVENGEGLQILNYKVGAEYKPHFDYFPEDEGGSQKHLDKGGQRISTLVMYLNDVEVGGETVFPNVGLSVKPKRGSALYFEYCNSLGQLDALSLHGGASVVQGEKWIATKWMRQRKYT